MKKLVLVIGKAPSELNYDELVGKLMAERERISDTMLLNHPKPKAKAVRQKAKSRKKTLNKADLEKLAKLTGMRL